MVVKHFVMHGTPHERQGQGRRDGPGTSYLLGVNWEWNYALAHSRELNYARNWIRAPQIGPRLGSL